MRAASSGVLTSDGVQERGVGQRQRPPFAAVATSATGERVSGSDASSKTATVDFQAASMPPRSTNGPASSGTRTVARILRSPRFTISGPLETAAAALARLGGTPSARVTPGRRSDVCTPGSSRARQRKRRTGIGARVRAMTQRAAGAWESPTPKATASRSISNAHTRSRRGLGRSQHGVARKAIGAPVSSSPNAFCQTTTTTVCARTSSAPSRG